MALLEVSDIYLKEGDLSVLKGAGFTQRQFQKIAVSGESGSGKSSLLKVIAGLAQPESGYVLFEGKKVKGPYERLIAGEPGIAYLSQYYELRNKYRVEEVLEYANELPGQEASSLFKLCRISHLLKRWTSELSGGEKQRIALARLLISAPRLLLLDEPFSNLDPIHKHILKKVVGDISEKLQITCLLVSHDPADTLSWADEILVMKSGKIIQRGTPENIYRHPVDAYTAGLFGKFNMLNAATVKQFRRSGEGCGESGESQESLDPEENNQEIFIRPEQFRLSLNEKEGVPGVVSKVLFQGSASELEINLGDSRITAKAANNRFVNGQTLYVSLSG